MPKSSSGAPKKARWTTAQKAAATKKPHRGASNAPTKAPRTAAPRSRPLYAASTRGDDTRRPDRDSRPVRADRPVRDDRYAARTDRPVRDSRPVRSDRPVRDDRYARTDRPVRDDRYGRRTDRPARSDRPVRDDRYAPRTDRPVRDDRSDRAVRDDRYAPRTDRPVRDDRYAQRTDRTERPVRDDRYPTRTDRPDRYTRQERPMTDDRRPAREPRPYRAGAEDRPRRDGAPRGGSAWSDRRPARAFPTQRGHHVPSHTEAGFDPEAERMAADSWTKSTRTSVSDGPVEIAADNGFAALGLPERLVERLARDGITAPFPIQTATIPDALAGRDVLGRGQTGSGKTLAFGLPLLARLIEEAPRSAPRRPRALVLVPTRELAMQVSDALEPLVHVLGLRHKLVAGGLSYTTQINALNRGVDLLIATPGRLNDLIERGAVELRDLRIVVLDEADHMAEMGFLPEITQVLDRIPEGGQRLLFSATLDRGIDGLVERYLTDAVTHSTDDATASVTTMAHHVLLIDPQHKKVITAEVANRDGRTLVFVRTKLGADRVAEQLREQGVMAASLHGGHSQGLRNRVLGGFRDGTLPVLVATDVAARGIHVDDVSVVLQVDPAADHKDYLHRSGRTARAGEKGTVVTLALPHQRRTMERQLRDAGVDAVPTRAVPGDDVLAATGARSPSGVPVAEDAYRRLIEGERRPGRGAGRPGGPAGARGPRGAGSGPRHGGPRQGGGERRPRSGYQRTT